LTSIKNNNIIVSGGEAMKLKPLSGKCPECGSTLTFHHYELDKEGNQIKIWVCPNSDCGNNEMYYSYS
jgi:ribosomal protein S27AE